MAVAQTTANGQRARGDSPEVNLSHFQIIAKIGAGQSSEVFKANYLPTGERVALKKIKIFEMMDAKARLDCLKEISLLKELHHPNVIRFHTSFFDAQEHLYIVLEFADAGDLTRLIRHFRKEQVHIPEKVIWKYFCQICAALEHMHSRRVMHRDIKPANVFITSQGIVKLGDFGLGRAFSSRSFDARSLVGTPYYMSPERLHEAPYDFKSDIWSLGCLLYEMAARQSPFFADGMVLARLVKKIEACDYVPLSEDQYSAELRDLVARCLRTRPDQRPTAAEANGIAQRMNANYQAGLHQSGHVAHASSAARNRYSIH